MRGVRKSTNITVLSENTSESAIKRQSEPDRLNNRYLLFQLTSTHFLQTKAKIAATRSEMVSS